MTRIVLEISQEKDLDLLLSLLERLNIRVVQKIDEKEQSSIQADRILILKGLPAKKDFNAFIQDFEESRKDRSLPGREN